MNRSREARITRRLAFLYCAVIAELLKREENNTYGQRESEHSQKLCFLAVLVMASQQDHLSEPILPPFFPASLHMHNQLNKSSTIIPDFLPSSEFVGPETLPDYLPSHLPALIATALKWTGFFHDSPDYECRLTLDEHALAANLGYHSYREWLMALYSFFSLPFERSARRKQRLMDAARREEFYYTRPQN